jgi:hypothetical protein
MTATTTTSAPAMRNAFRGPQGAPYTAPFERFGHCGVGETHRPARCSFRLPGTLRGADEGVSLSARGASAAWRCSDGTRVVSVKLLLNLIWLIFGGLLMALGYAIVALVMFILIITIPFGIASARIALFCLWPFGRTLVRRPDAGAGSLIGNIIWSFWPDGGWRSATSSPVSSCA